MEEVAQNDERKLEQETGKNSSVVLLGRKREISGYGSCL